MSASSANRRPPQPLAITGLGCIGAPGRGLDAQRTALAIGACGLALAPDAGLPLAAQVPVGRVTAALPPLPSRTAALALAATHDALIHAGLADGHGDAALVVGTCTGGMPESERVFLGEGSVSCSPIYRRQHPHRTTQALARLLKLGGPQGTHAVACASAACAMVEAVELVRSGACPLAVVVGADALARVTMAGFTSLMLVDPAGCRPLTMGRSGMSLGEGAAALVIEHPDHARRRGARILATLAGWGLSADAHHITSPDPSGVHLTRAIDDCLADAGAAPSAVGYVNAHGTGTRDNDQCETQVLANRFGAVPTASAKRIYGHTMGACAAIEAVACCLALADGRLWPCAGAADAEVMGGVEVLKTVRSASIDLALSTTLAFGGVNACLAFGRAERCA